MIETHVDDFVIAHDSDDYAAWVLMHFRLPATMQVKFRKFMENHKLFCHCMGTRYRVIGASRMGDIWLTEDFNKTNGYDERADITHCTNFGPTP